MEDIRWEQRFSNFSKALLQMGKIINKAELNEIEEQGLIKAFETSPRRVGAGYESILSHRRGHYWRVPSNAIYE